MKLNINAEKIRFIIGKNFSLILFSVLIIDVIFSINLIFKGHDYFSVFMVFFISLGFLLSFHPKISYLGALLMGLSTTYLLFSAIFSIFTDLFFVYKIIASLIFSISSILVPHYFTKEKRITLSNFSVTFFGVLSYILTTLFLTSAFGGVEMESNIPLFLIATGFIIFFLVLVTNRCYRETQCLKIIDISDFNIYYNQSEALKRIFRKYTEKTEVVISDFKSSIDSFINGDFQRTIEYSYMSLEGIDRLLRWTGKNELTKSEYSEDYIKVRTLRNKLAHSSVSKKIGKEEGNNSDKKDKIGYNEAYNSIRITNIVISRIS